MLRIPGWASGATLSTYKVSASGRLSTVSEAAPLANGPYHAVHVEPGAMALTIDFNPQIRVDGITLPSNPPPCDTFPVRTRPMHRT